MTHGRPRNRSGHRRRRAGPLATGHRVRADVPREVGAGGLELGEHVALHARDVGDDGVRVRLELGARPRPRSRPAGRRRRRAPAARRPGAPAVPHRRPGRARARSATGRAGRRRRRASVSARPTDVPSRPVPTIRTGPLRRQRHMPTRVMREPTSVFDSTRVRPGLRSPRRIGPICVRTSCVTGVADLVEDPSHDAVAALVQLDLHEAGLRRRLHDLELVDLGQAVLELDALEQPRAQRRRHAAVELRPGRPW